jgi:hypothetical protein
LRFTWSCVLQRMCAPPAKCRRPRPGGALVLATGLRQLAMTKMGQGARRAGRLDASLGERSVCSAARAENSAVWGVSARTRRRSTRHADLHHSREGPLAPPFTPPITSFPAGWGGQSCWSAPVDTRGNGWHVTRVSGRKFRGRRRRRGNTGGETYAHLLLHVRQAARIREVVTIVRGGGVDRHIRHNRGETRTAAGHGETHLFE